MKTYVEFWRVVFKEINDGIKHAEREGLPLRSIELDKDEWETFVSAFEDKKVGTGQLQTSVAALRKYEQTRYMGIKIYKERGAVNEYCMR